MNTVSKLLISSVAIALSASAASASPIIGLYNTGVDSTGTVLTGSNATDVHYLVNGLPTFTTNNGLYVQSPTAAYIASAANGGGGSATYSLTFDLGSLNAATATLSGKTAYDNGVSVYLNGHLLYSDVPADPGTFSAFETLHSFAATGSDFVAGSNTLTFDVIDYSPPTGLLVTDLVGTAAVPETATWAMMFVGFGMIGFAARRRGNMKTTVTFA